jgi:hypothetical protein
MDGPSIEEVFAMRFGSFNSKCGGGLRHYLRESYGYHVIPAIRNSSVARPMSSSGQQTGGSMRKLLLAAVVVAMASGAAVAIKSLIPATSIAAASPTVATSTDELRLQEDLRSLPPLQIEDLF